MVHEREHARESFGLRVCVSGARSRSRHAASWSAVEWRPAPRHGVHTHHGWPLERRAHLQVHSPVPREDLPLAIGQPPLQVQGAQAGRARFPRRRHGSRRLRRQQLQAQDQEPPVALLPGVEEDQVLEGVWRARVQAFSGLVPAAARLPPTLRASERRPGRGESLFIYTFFGYEMRAHKATMLRSSFFRDFNFYFKFYPYITQPTYTYKSLPFVFFYIA